jgi:hypothetical protein
MSSIEEARQALEAQRQLVKEQQERAENARKALEEQRRRLPNIRTQQALRGQKNFKEGLAGMQQRRTILGKEKDISGKQSAVSAYQEQLSQYETEQLNPYEKQIQEAEAQQKAQQEVQAKAADYNYALRVYLGQTSGGNIGRIDPSIREEAKKAAEGMENSARISSLLQFGKEQGLKPVIVNGQITGFEDTVKQMSIPVPNLALGSSEDIARYEKAGITFKEVPVTQTKELDQLNLVGSAKNVLISAKPISLYTGGKGVVDLPPSRTSQFFSQIKEKGLVGGTLSYVSEKSGSFFYEREMNQDRPYQPEGQMRVVKFVTQTLPFFSPVGAGLMVVAGGEKFLFGSREYQGKPSEFSQEKTQLKEAGFNPLFSNIIVYGKPALEIGLGTLGVRSQVKVDKIPQTEFAGTISRSGDTSQIDVLAKTSQGDQNIFSIGRQVVKPIEGTNKFLSVGKGYNVLGDVKQGLEFPTLRKVTKIPEVKPFISISKGEELGTGYVVKELPGGKIRGELGQGSLSGDTGLIYRKQGDVNVFTGGKVSKRISGDPLELYGSSKTSYLIRKPTIKGYLKELPVAESIETGVKILTPANIKKTPFSLTFPEQKAVSSLVTNIQKSSVKSFKPVESKPVSLFGTISTTEIQAKNQPSVWSGTGMYERTEEYGAGITGQKTKETGVNLLGFDSTLTQRERQKGVNLFSDFNLEIEKQKTPQRIKEEFKLVESYKNRLGQLLGVSQTQEQKQRYVNIIDEVSKTSTTPKKTIIPIPKKESQFKSKIKEIAKDILGFKAFYRKKGEDILLGEFESKPQAETKLKNFLAGDIAASGFVEQGGKKQRLSFDNMFKPSKRDIFRIVEEERFRLNTPKGEVWQIQKAKKRKKKFNWFS